MHGNHYGTRHHQDPDETTPSDVSERPSVDDVESDTGSNGALETRSLKDHKGNTGVIVCCMVCALKASEVEVQFPLILFSNVLCHEQNIQQFEYFFCKLFITCYTFSSLKHKLKMYVDFSIVNCTCKQIFYSLT